jgi:hypothetical protein
MNYAGDPPLGGARPLASHQNIFSQWYQVRPLRVVAPPLPFQFLWVLSSSNPPSALLTSRGMAVKIRSHVVATCPIIDLNLIPSDDDGDLQIESPSLDLLAFLV